MSNIWRDFGATNKDDTCLWCGKRLPIWAWGPERGYGGAGHFCTVRCAFNFAERIVEIGKRFEPVVKDEATA